MWPKNEDENNRPKMGLVVCAACGNEGCVFGGRCRNCGWVDPGFPISGQILQAGQPKPVEFKPNPIEYATFHTTLYLPVEQLNKLGGDGWILCSEILCVDFVRTVFRRPLA